MSRKNVIVSPHGPGKWTVKEAGASRPASTHHTQQAAAEKGRRIAKENESELIIQGRDGQIRSKDSCGRDPNPPKDKEH